MTLDEYFAQPDTPGRRSPVGGLMGSILSKNSFVSFEDARVQASRRFSCGSDRTRTPKRRSRWPSATIRP